ncbi:hypothetical protein WJX79_006456 [Trebouxia sp. C0005]
MFERILARSIALFRPLHCLDSNTRSDGSAAARKRYVETAVVQPQLGVANKSGVVRAHGNLAEYYAAFFLLLAILECNEAADSKVLNCLGTGFVLARVSHAYQLSAPERTVGKFKRSCADAHSAQHFAQ